MLGRSGEETRNVPVEKKLVCLCVFVCLCLLFVVCCLCLKKRV